MASEDIGFDNEDRPFTNPWPWLTVGAGALFLALGMSALVGKSWTPALGILVGIGLLATAGAIAIAPRSAPLLGSAAFLALVARTAAQQANWDSTIYLLFAIMAALAGVSALLVLLPRFLQRVVVSLLILFHFGGILTAVASAPPRPWIMGQIWTYVYRPYLQFMYLNNAYHFYSPEPGPAYLMWFRIEYEPDPDSTTKYVRWVKIPELDDSGRPIEGRSIERGALDKGRRYPGVNYTRRLSLAESINMPAQLPMNIINDHQHKRFVAGRDARPQIPTHPSPLVMQYKEPNAYAKKWVASYARHVARAFKHKDKPEKEVAGVKVYLATHVIVPQNEFAATPDFFDPTLYLPYYMGEFDKDGTIKPTCRRTEFNSDGMMVDIFRDPFLYTLIPILRGDRPGREGKIINYMKIHAGDEEEGDQP